MRVYLVIFGVILCAVYTHSESRQYYPGIGYVTTRNGRPSVQTSSKLRAAPVSNARNYQRPRTARLRDEYELIEREELSPNRRSRTGTRNTNRRASRRSSTRRYRFARNELTTVAPPASEPVAAPAVVPPPASSSSASSSPASSFGSSPAGAFGGIFPSFQGNGGVTGGGFAQTNGPGAAFAAGFAQSSGSSSFAGGFGAVIQHPRFPKFGGSNKPTTKDHDLDDISSSKDHARSDDSGLDDPIDDTESDDDQKLDRIRRRYRG